MTLEESNDLIINNLGLVYSVVKDIIHTNNQNQDFDDIVAIGNEGLVKAARRFDPTTGNKFSTYAIATIYNEICHQYFKRKTKERLFYTSILYLDDVITDNDKHKTTYNDIIPDEGSDFTEDYGNNDLYKYFLTLDFKNKDIFMKWLKGKSISDIARERHVSRQRIDQILKKTKEDLRLIIDPTTV